MDKRKTIYLDDALEAIRKLPNAGIHWLVSAEAVFDAILKLPSAQPEIIKCKECKYWREYKYVNGRPKFLPRCGFHQTYVREDDFCSAAERRTDE